MLIAVGTRSDRVPPLVGAQTSLCTARFVLDRCVTWKGLDEQPAQVRPKKLSVHLGSYLDIVRGDPAVKLQGHGPSTSWVGERTGRNASEA
jgi:hypothetical protein